MTDEPVFSYSDSVAGYVTGYEADRVSLRALDGQELTLYLTETTYAQLLRNLGAPYQDVTDRLGEYLVPGALVFSYGPVYNGTGGARREIGHLVFVGDRQAPYLFETRGWWIQQTCRLARFYFGAEFGSAPVDFGAYRTVMRSTGQKTGQQIQETDTLSRLIYGMATAFMLTGEQGYLDAAENGSGYLREHLRFVDPVEDIVYWYHGLDLAAGRERKLFASESDDDYRALPAYEQIYALVGLTQTYRLTGRPEILADIEATLRLFDRHYADHRLGGYFSHIDPVTLSPYADSLGRNQARKNWNSVGDHAPAYLFNLYLATGDQRHRKMLEHIFDMIAVHLPDRSDPPSPFVHERFHSDWAPDIRWGWQQNRAVIGHNLKIAWNLMRFNTIIPKPEYRELAERIATTLPAIARDGRRGGWYDMVERVPRDGRYVFPWHDRKAWWQQEQAILAYLILAGHTGDDAYLRHGREAAAFYNAFFLDHDEGAIYPTVLAEGLPFTIGEERLKGSHAMSMYHMSELCLLAETYTRLLVQREPMDFWFRPRPDAAYPGGLLRVSPDALPPGRIVLDGVTIDGEPYEKYDARALAIDLPDTERPVTVRARLCPVDAPSR